MVPDYNDILNAAEKEINHNCFLAFTELQSYSGVQRDNF